MVKGLLVESAALLLTRELRVRVCVLLSIMRLVQERVLTGFYI